MTIFELLNLRYEFEELVRTMKIPHERKAGTIENLKWFRSRYSKNDASTVANEILKNA